MRLPAGRVRTGPNVAVAGFGFALLAAFASLYAAWPSAYTSILDLWAFYPFQYPFLDLIYIGAGVECFQKGIDVYLTNPCDPLNRVHDYAPLWLRMSFLLATKTWPKTCGLAMDGLFVLSLLALPKLRHRIDTLIVMACVASPVTLYALERGNVDVAMFILTVVAVTCLHRGIVGRLAGYAAILLAGLLKFFPFVLFALLYRERPRLGALLALIAVTVMAGFAWTYRTELPQMAANIPVPNMFTGGFGAGQLPQGLQVMLRHAPGVSGRIAFSVVFMSLLVTSGLTALALARGPRLRGMVRSLSSHQALCLLAGALLVCGCFFAGRSISYRAVNLLLIIPGLLTLARLQGNLAWLFRASVALAVFLMWYLVPERALYDAFGGNPDEDWRWPSVAFWVGREVSWWALVTLLLAVIAAFAMDRTGWFGRNDAVAGE